MTPLARTLPVNGIELSYFEWPGTDDARPLIFAHATGFHARVWDAVIDHFPRRRVLSIDLRGHGRSTGGPIDRLRSFSDDATAFIDALDISDAIGIGHSMGAHTLAQAASERVGAFAKLVLFDPVILAPEFYAPQEPLFTPDNPHPTSKRRRDFDSVEAMIDRFRDRDPYDLFDRRVFEDYCRFGLQPKPSGQGFELACAPEMEASVYAAGRSNPAILDVMARLDVATLIVRAKQTNIQDFKSSPTWPLLAQTMPNGTDMPRPDMTHFHPFEDPADAARIIREFAD